MSYTNTNEHAIDSTNMKFSEKINIGDIVEVMAFIKFKFMYDSSEGFGAFSVKLLSYSINDSEMMKVIGDEDITISGYTDELRENQTYSIKGTINEYKNKGEKQINILYSEEVVPSNAQGIYEYLASGIIKGLGSKTAEKLVFGYQATDSFHTGFGDKTLDIIEHDYARLTEISGISIHKAQNVHDYYMRTKVYKNLILFIKDKGIDITPNQAMKIYKKHGADTLSLLTNDPYSLSDTVRGFGFRTCDRIALSSGMVSVHNESRLRSGILYCMEEAQISKGHCYLSEKEIVKSSIDMLSLSISMDDCEALLKRNEGMNEISMNIYNKTYRYSFDDFKMMYDKVRERRKKNADEKLIIDYISEDEIVLALQTLASVDQLKAVYHNNEYCFYMTNTYNEELEIARILNEYKKTRPYKFKSDIRLEIELYERENNVILEEKQKETIIMMIENNIGILYGNAGSGKSYMVNALITIMKKIYKRERDSFEVILCSPTGRASKRLEEYTGIEARTIHRTLMPSSDGFLFNEDNKLICDMIIVDESSMIDLHLFYALLKAVDIRMTKIMFVGDNKQILPVGIGCPFVDMLKANKIPKVMLNVIKRQAENSGIVSNAGRVIEKQIIKSDNINNDFFVIYKESPEDVANLIMASVKRLVESNRFKIDDIQVLCPQKEKVIGTIEMNKRLQKMFNPYSKDKKELLCRGVVYRVGDRVMHTSNNYNVPHYVYDTTRNEYVKRDGERNVGVFNGDIGKVVDILNMYIDDEKTLMVVVQYDDKFILYDWDSLNDLEHSFAMTNHKSQGSQFPAVITCLHTINYVMLNNNLTYMVLTRGRELVCVIGNVAGIKRAIENQDNLIRNTRLSELIA